MTCSTLQIELAICKRMFLFLSAITNVSWKAFALSDTLAGMKVNDPQAYVRHSEGIFHHVFKDDDTSSH